MKVSIIMGSTSDLEVMTPAMKTLDEFGIEYEKRVISAHRTPDLMCEYAKSARSRGIGVMTTVPVIGVPIQTKALGGLDSLLSIVQMPGGVPVATMAINGAKNAALLAVEIFALADPALQSRLVAYRKKQTDAVLQATI